MGKRILETAIPSKVADQVACHEIQIRYREDAVAKEFKLDSLYYEVMAGTFDANGNFVPIAEEELVYKVPSVNGGTPYSGRRVKVGRDQIPPAVLAALEENLTELVERDWIRRNNLVEKAEVVTP